MPSTCTRPLRRACPAEQNSKQPRAPEYALLAWLLERSWLLQGMWPGPPSGAAGGASLTSRISTRRLVRFLILMATSCGLKMPHTMTRPCFLSIRWLCSSEKKEEKGSEKSLKPNFQASQMGSWSVYLASGGAPS